MLRATIEDVALSIAPYTSVLDRAPQPLDHAAVRLPGRALNRRQVKDEREEEPLGGPLALSEVRDDLLVEDPLVRGVLVDDREPASGLGKDEPVVELP